MTQILFVLTGARHWTLADGTQHPTGFWADEAVAPYEAFTAVGHEVVVATPGGVVPAVDEASLSADANGGQDNADRVAAGLESFTALGHPLSIEDVRIDSAGGPAGFDAVFYPGGHGPMEDLATDSDSGTLLVRTLASGRPLGVVCHGPAALLAAHTQEGANAVHGYRLTGFTNAEERMTGLADKAKWLLQDRLVEAGAHFDEGEPWAPHVVVDHNLVTGQNPASAGPVAAELIKMLG
ncbi:MULTISPECIES: type 1 glutamine amidotransferase domain-containing protein [Streptomyces]|uniref:Thiamine biosynthesis protein ThiJ n=1 Tax=Streptomyces qinglanensis TaxID=943816 RepID=A0A1E7K0H6_9ACTN|nr:type 1 glutamine amidotransferase domain-containing protein [Streptomyces qinglanensis]OEU97447.1 thiamine biosynthesis protein ThiJ [Streptomyces qinglanensis]OEV26156.1 thiamine biosynthesis protein ThiJ [Streptomyces nanshensis]